MWLEAFIQNPLHNFLNFFYLKICLKIDQPLKKSNSIIRSCKFFKKVIEITQVIATYNFFTFLGSPFEELAQKEPAPKSQIEQQRQSNLQSYRRDASIVRKSYEEVLKTAPNFCADTKAKL